MKGREDMGKYIIFEDRKEALAAMYGLLQKEKPDKDFLLVKCNYNHNIPIEEAEKKEKEDLKNLIQKEKVKRQLSGAPEILIMMTEEELIARAYEGKYEKEDIAIMDIALFDQAEDGKDSFEEYASVRLGRILVGDLNLKQSNVRFYTRSMSESDPCAFLEQTDGCWRVPVLRPHDFASPGNESEVEIFTKELLGDVQEDKKGEETT